MRTLALGLVELMEMDMGHVSTLSMCQGRSDPAVRDYRDADAGGGGVR
jgi:hypothetical protein